MGLNSKIFMRKSTEEKNCWDFLFHFSNYVQVQRGIFHPTDQSGKLSRKVLQEGDTVRSFLNHSKDGEEEGLSGPGV